MAKGDGQHYVPRFMLRGFLAETNSSSEQVYSYWKGGKSHLVNLNGFGMQNRYYKQELDNSADEIISKEEQRISHEISAMRRMLSGAVVDSQSIASIIAHFEIRSAFLRSSLTTTSSDFFTTFLRRISTRRGFRKGMLSYASENPDAIRDTLQRQTGLSDIPDQIIDLLVREALKGGSPQLENVRNSLSSGAQELANLMPSAVKSAHLKAIVEGIESAERGAHYRGLRYVVQHSPIHSFVLPDSVTCFVMKDRVRPILTAPDQIEAVILPISHSTVVVGSRGGVFQRSVKTICRMLASVAFERFASSVASPSRDGLAAKISSAATLVEDIDLMRILKANHILG